MNQDRNVKDFNLSNIHWLAYSFTQDAHLQMCSPCIYTNTYTVVTRLQYDAKHVYSICEYAQHCVAEWGTKKLHRCQVNLHKQGAMSLRMKEEMWNWTSTHREITTGGCIVHLKAVKTRREQEESTSEDNSALQHGDSRMHSTVTKKHHLDRVKTSEVTIAMCPFVCVCVFISLCLFYVTELPHHLLVPALA